MNTTQYLEKAKMFVTPFIGLNEADNQQMAKSN